MSFNDPRLNRRSLLAFASAITASGVMSASGLAQTTDATPSSSAAGDSGGTPVAGTPVAGIEPGDVIPPEYVDMPDTDWLTENRNLAQDRSVPGSPIDSSTVSGLQQAWTFELDTSAAYGALVANPIVHGEKVYLQDALGNIYALNRETGELLWETRYEEPVPSGGPNGIAVGYGVIAYSLGDGSVIVADKDSGEELWRTNIAGPKGEGITTAPLIYNNQVWISTIPGDPDKFYQGGMRGVIHVLDIADGRVLWYFDTIDDNLWGNPAVNSGGGFWHPPAVGTDGGMFFPIGNAAPYPGTEEYPAGSSRPGNNDYANNVLRIDPDTGELLWHTNITGRDIFDLDNHLVAFGTVEWEDGYTRDLVFTAGKHGFVVALDPVSGAQFWRTPVGTHRNSHLQDIPEGEEYETWPGVLGGVETQFAYQDGVVYVPIFESPTIWGGAARSEDTPTWATSVGKLVALDAKNGNILWEVDVPSGVLASATVVNDLVITGTLDGRLRAYSTSDGSLVWSIQTSAGLNAGPAISGEYVFVPAGGPLLPSDESEDVELKAQLIAYKLG
jgi:outer membrane protein assembly factor BamB